MDKPKLARSGSDGSRTRGERRFRIDFDKGDRRPSVGVALPVILGVRERRCEEPQAQQESGGPFHHRYQVGA
ncbi:MAG: hypothetical protein AB7O56_02465 [Bauldia sp.]